MLAFTQPAHSIQFLIINFQITELTEQITTYEDEVKLLIARNAKTSPSTSIPNGDGEEEDAVPIDQAVDDAGSDDDMEEDVEDQFVELEEDLANVIADVHDLGKL